MIFRRVAITAGVVLALTVLVLAVLFVSFLKGDETCEIIVGSEPPKACESP